ncbi:MAG: hypothetical protein ACU843_00165 [Gammaproteobacteria bacterium]
MPILVKEDNSYVLSIDRRSKSCFKRENQGGFARYVAINRDVPVEVARLRVAEIPEPQLPSRLHALFARGKLRREVESKA